MVLLNAGKAARNQGKTVNRTNTCGGMKKAGIGKGIGTSRSAVIMGVMRRSTQSVPKSCSDVFISKVVQTQKYGYHATH
jgi:hypothetical protein